MSQMDLERCKAGDLVGVRPLPSRALGLTCAPQAQGLVRPCLEPSAKD